MPTVHARPYDYPFDPAHTAVVMIDMQRDFLEPGGFGAMLGNDVAQLAGIVPACARLLALARAQGMTVIHTQEAHDPQLADCPPAKRARGRLDCGIGDRGPLGRVLVEGEPGAWFVSELLPQAGDIVLRKPGKGAFHATELEQVLRNRGIAWLLVCGVTTEVCVHTTVREANDRGYRCVVLGDCCASYFPEFHEVGLRMIAAQGGIFGWVSRSTDVLAAMAALDAAA